ncbi:MAG: phosphatase PAP2 family protein [Acidimicrobiia bacterium]
MTDLRVDSPDAVASNGVVRARWPRVVFAVLIALLVLGYLAAVCTRWGQRIDDLGLGGGFVRKELAGDEAYWTQVGRLVDLALAAALMIAAGAALVRRELRLAVAIVGAVGAVVLVAWVMKFALPRPSLVLRSPIGHNTYPSGHVATATTIAGALVAAATPRWRAVALALGALLIAVVAAVALTGAEHRISDTTGGLALGLAAGLGLAMWFAPPIHRTMVLWGSAAVAGTVGVFLALVAAVGFMRDAPAAARGTRNRSLQFELLGWGRWWMVALALLVPAVVALAVPFWRAQGGADAPVDAPEGEGGVSGSRTPP